MVVAGVLDVPGADVVGGTAVVETAVKAWQTAPQMGWWMELPSALLTA